MLKHLASLRLVAWFVILASPALVRAQALADRLPGDTIFYLGLRGIDSPGPGFEGSHLQAVVAESNLPKVLDEMLPKLLDRIAQEDHDAAHAVEVFRGFLEPMLRRPTAIAFVGVDLANKIGPSPKLVILCDAGADAAAIKLKLDQLLQKGGHPPFPVHVVNHDGLIAVIVGYENPADATPAPEKSLAQNPDFIKALEHVNKDAFITEYVDIERAISLIDEASMVAPPEIRVNYQVISDKLGVKGIKRAILTEGFSGKDWSSKLFIAAPAPRTGLLSSLLESKPLSDEIISAIPENATLAGAFHFDLAALVDAIHTGVAGIDPNTGHEVDQMIAQVNQTVGFDVQKDLLGALGGEWAYYNDPAVAGNGVVGSTFVNHLKHPAKVEASLTKLEDFINVMAANELKHEKVTIAFRKAKIGDTTIHYLAIPLVTPAWAVKDGNLYVALYPEIVGAAVTHVPAKGKSIANNTGYIALMAKLGNHAPSTFAFADLPKLAPENYSSWLVLSHFVNAADVFGVPAPIMILPPLDKLLQHLEPAGNVSWTDADGLHFNGLTPFPGSEIFAANPTNFMLGEAVVGWTFLRVASKPKMMMPAPVPQLQPSPPQRPNERHR